MDEPYVNSAAVTQVVEHLLRVGYFDDELDARRALKHLIEEVDKMSDGEDDPGGERKLPVLSTHDGAVD
jgi:hypothetical protein